MIVSVLGGSNKGEISKVSQNKGSDSVVIIKDTIKLKLPKIMNHMAIL